MKIQGVIRRAGVVCLVALAACGGGAASPVAGLSSAATSLTVDEDGFSFANFSAKKTTEEFGTADLVEMFGAGPDVCSGGSEPCTPTAEAAAFARMVNQARSSGHCEGLVALAASRFANKVTPKTSTLGNDADVIHAIMRAFATQFLPESVAATSKWASKSLGEILAELAANFSKNVPEYTLNVYTANGGHALLPRSIEMTGADSAVVHVYDSNWPGQDRYVTFDLKAGTWSFSFSGADPANDPGMWTGGKGDIDITSLSSRASGSCPFCGDGTKVANTLLVIRSVDDKVSVTTDDGTVSPSDPDAGGTTMKPVNGRFSANPKSGEPHDYVVTVPATSTKVSVNAGSEAHVIAVTPETISEVAVPEGGSPSPVEVTATSISSDDAGVKLTLASGENVITSAGANNSLSAGATGVSATVDGAGGTPVTVSTNGDQPAIEVIAAGNDLPAGADYVVKAQVSADSVEQTVVAKDGSKKTTSVDGTLGNTSTSANLSEKLAPTETVPGLGGAAPVAVTTTVAGSGATVPPSGDKTTATTKPKSATTTTVKAVARTAVSVGINLDEWSYGPSDPASTGFSASLTMTDADPQSCTSAACLEGMAVDGVSSGTDPATNRVVDVTATFTMRSVTVPFSARCGTKGSWTAATASGGTYSVTCSISSVSKDETIYLRA